MKTSLSAKSREYLSWGRSIAAEQQVHYINYQWDIQDFSNLDITAIPYGQGRSYGDCCLNDGGVILYTDGLKRFMSFDHQTGLLRCESGVKIIDILKIFVPRGWFLPVVPGTAFVSIGGAIANDIHGKNHHKAGSFGHYVTQFELIRSNGSRHICSANQNSELFYATIGGIGLTGLITWAEIQLKKIPSMNMTGEYIRLRSIDDYFQYETQSDDHYEYTVTWIDLCGHGSELGRGVMMRANHDTEASLTGPYATPRAFRIPFAPPVSLIQPWNIPLFNKWYLKRFKTPMSKLKEPIHTFFFPLDRVQNWNLLYGPYGFYQFQCVIPTQNVDGVVKILEHTQKKASSFLTVLKKFGQKAGRGCLSFPKPGYTLAIDLANHGHDTVSLLHELERIVLEHDGRIYLAKDAVMFKESFQEMYRSSLTNFSAQIDPKYFSNMRRRFEI